MKGLAFLNRTAHSQGRWQQFKRPPIMKLKILKLMVMLTAITITISSLNAQDYNIYFDFNSDILRINDIGKLHNVLQEFNPNEHSIHLVGHTDTVGNYETNLDLSKRRTNAVKKYLVEKGIASNSITTEYQGKLVPVASDQFYNRRVEIFLSTKQDDILTFEGFRTSLRPKLQKFIVPADINVEIEGNRGTIVTIPANSFVTKTGEEVLGNVEIRLTEFYSMKDFFSEKLSTVSNGELLTSAGMVDINVVQDSEELILRGGREIELAFPKTNDIKYFTFYGERQENGNMNWQSDKRQVLSENHQNIDGLGVTFGNDGNSLVITDETTADERNSQIRYNPLTRKFGVLSTEENKEVDSYFEEQEKYYAEQEIIDMKRGNYYNVIYSKGLNYINCDEFISDTSAVFVNYTITLSNNKLKIITAALIFRKTNSYLELPTLDDLNARVNAKMPINDKVELLVIGTRNDQPYIYHSEIKLTKKKNDLIELSATSYEEIKEKL